MTTTMAPPRNPRTSSTLLRRLSSDMPRKREQAWEEFDRLYRLTLRRFVLSRGCRASEADEVVQDVIASFFQRSDRFVYRRERGGLRGYLFVCVVNELRRRSRARRTCLASVADLEITTDLETAWKREWERARLERIFGEMAARFGQGERWACYELHVLRCVPAPAVASRFGVSVNAVHKSKSVIGRAIRERLAELREAELDDG